MRREMIEEYVKKLSVSLGGVRPPVPEETLRDLHEAHDILGMVDYVRGTLNLPVRINIEVLNDSDMDLQDKSFGRRGVARIAFPEAMPPYGTGAFRKVKCEMWIRKSLAYQAPLPSLVKTIAHELSHIVLYAVQHELRDEEEAVDVTAMVLGYRNICKAGCVYNETVFEERKPSFLRRALDRFFCRTTVIREEILVTHSNGYLTVEEVYYAADLMERIAKK